MSQQELLKKVVQVLEEAEIEYMISGSIVSSFQGEPRSTHDIDIVIDLKETSVNRLLERFGAPDYYLDEDRIFEAIRHRSMFNLLEIKEGDKVDFWLLTDDPFDRSRFARRERVDVMGMQMYVSSPEDTVLMKLKWAKLSGGSEKQFGDALHIYEVQSDHLDLNYIEHWVKRLNIQDLWNRLKTEAQQP